MFYIGYPIRMKGLGSRRNFLAGWISLKNKRCWESTEKIIEAQAIYLGVLAGVPPVPSVSKTSGRLLSKFLPLKNLPKVPSITSFRLYLPPAYCLFSPGLSLVAASSPTLSWASWQMPPLSGVRSSALSASTVPTPHLPSC